jgi:molybdopterin-binding protein
MALSARNRLPAQITEVVKGEAAARVSLQAGDWQMVALITRESATYTSRLEGAIGSCLTLKAPLRSRTSPVCAVLRC